MSRIFALVGIVFGSVFVFVNAGGLPGPWDAVARIAGVVLVLVAVWFGIVRRRSDGEAWNGTPKGYWIAVAAEAAAIPLGAVVLNEVFDQPDLVVLWVVFVVGAHFLPARTVKLGRFAELGAVMMLIAVVAASVRLGAGTEWAPAAGAVLTGFLMLAFSAIPALGRPAVEADA